MERLGFDQDLGHSDAVEPVGHLPAIDLLPGGMAAVDFAPFSQPRTLIVAIPEAPVEDFGEFFLELGCQLRTVGPVTDGIRRLSVAGCGFPDIFSAPGPAFYLEDLDSRVHDSVHELNGAEVFGRHYVLVVDVELVSCFQVGDLVASPA